MGLTLFWQDTLTHNLSSLHTHSVTTLWVLHNVLISVRDWKQSSQPGSQPALSFLFFQFVLIFCISPPQSLPLKKIFIFILCAFGFLPWLSGSWITDSCELPCRCWELNLNYLCNPTWKIPLYSPAWITFRVHSAPWVNVLCFPLLYI